MSAVRPAADRAAPPWLEWAVAGRARPDEEVSGDAALVEIDGTNALVAAVDGLGHGPAAAQASQCAVEVLRGGAGTDVDELVRRCHEALRGTRGAAIGIASISGDTLAWTGVGNVEGWIFRGAGAGRARPRAFLLRPGVVGAALPAVQAAHEQLQRGDVVIVVSDGVSPHFADDFDPVGAPNSLAEGILDRFARAADDAVVVVARYLGGQA